jgi:hypothetical protein
VAARIVAVRCTAAWAIALATWNAAANAAPSTTADRVAVRYFAAETGGIARPKWINARWLAFQAALEARGEGMRTASERHMRIALELEITETLLSLSPNERLLTQADEVRLVADLRAEHERRVGGADTFSQLATEFNVPPSQISAWVTRKARALHYADRAIAPIRTFDDSELRQSFRSHDDRAFGATFEEAREGLRRWLTVERLRALCSAHYQAARGRTKIVIVAR